MADDDNRKLYELQEYDNESRDFPPFQEVMQIHEKSLGGGGGGRIQIALQLIQLVLLVIILIVGVVILYQQFTTSDSSETSAAINSNGKVLTDLANTSTDTQTAVKEVSQIMIAEIERRLNDTTTLNRLAQTTDVSTQRILNAIFDVNTLTNVTNDAVDTSAQVLLEAIINAINLANVTSGDVKSSSEKLSKLMTLTEQVMVKVGATFAEEKEYILNNTELLNRLLNSTSASAAKLMNIVNTLSNIQETCTSTAGVVDDLLLIVEELVELHNETAALPTSCKHVLERQPNSPSGFYILAGTTGTYSTYCNMGNMCGSVGGWTRIGYLDMSDATQNCPSGLRYYNTGGVRACGSNTFRGGCSVSIRYPSNGISYTQICGRITAYQFGDTDPIDGVNNINANYLEGVSITRGSPRQHVWSFLAGLTEGSTNRCPCATGSSVTVRSFMGNNYFCESGNPNSGWSRTLYTADPLWDGQNCRSNEAPCCNGLPWFHRDYGSTSSTESLELRICSDNAYYEDTPISYLEMYIK